MAEKKPKFLNEKTKMKIVDGIIYGSILFIIFWAILKAAGVFNSPVWVELLPLIIGGIGAFFTFYKFGNSIGHLESDVGYLKKDVETLKHEMKEVKFDLRDFRKDYDYHIVKHHI